MSLNYKNTNYSKIMFSSKKHVNNIQKNGYTIIRNGTDINLADKIIQEFDEWSSIPKNKFVPFKGERVTNFHVYSKNTLDLVTNKNVNTILTSLFNKDQAIYSSLFFREGTTQPYHRDTPFFYTNPCNQYYGVLYALEDIDVNSGPLKYYVGSHKINNINGHTIFNDIYTNNDVVDLNNDFRCILQYNKKIEDICKELKLTEVNEKKPNKLYKGDIFICHPNLVHGESDIIDKTLTRYSLVTHNIPMNTAVFNAKHFFSKSPTKEYLKNECTLKYINHNDIQIVDHEVGLRVQKTYT